MLKTSLSTLLYDVEVYQMLKSPRIALHYLIPPTLTLTPLFIYSLIHSINSPASSQMAYKKSLFLETYRRFVWTHPSQGMWRSKSLPRISITYQGDSGSSGLYILDRSCHQCCLRCALTPSIHGCWTHYWWFGMGHLFLLFLFLFLFLLHLSSPSSPLLGFTSLE